MNSVFDISVSGSLPATGAWSDHQILYYVDGVLHFTGFSSFVDKYEWNDGSITINAPNSYYYDDGAWILVPVNEIVSFSLVAAQSIDASKPHYYSMAAIKDGTVPYSYSSNAFKSMETISVLLEVVSLLPVLLVVLVGYIGIRKGLGFIKGRLSRA